MLVSPKQMSFLSISNEIFFFQKTQGTRPHVKDRLHCWNRLFQSNNFLKCFPETTRLSQESGYYSLQILRRRSVFIAGASKATVDQLTRMMALELGPHQVND